MSEKNIFKKVLIINPSGFYEAIPCIVSAISYLKEQKYIIDVVSISGIKNNDDWLNDFFIFSSKKNPIFSIIGKLLFPFYLNYKVFHRKYDAVIAVDNWGLLYSFLIPKKTKKTIYLVLHIFSVREILRKRNYIYYILKIIEIKLVRKTKAVIIQDVYRQKLFMTENNLKARDVQFYILPNSHRGKINSTKGEYYNELFHINRSEKIVLLAGSIETWAFPEFLIDCTKNQDNRIYKSVIQSRTQIHKDDTYVINLKKNANDDVYFALNPVAIDKLDSAISSAHIGCAFYQSSTEVNHSILGAASGKMLAYLKNGLPIIMFHSPGVTELIEKYQCGKLLSSMNPLEFNTCVQEILDNYELYSTNAYLCFKENFDFDNSFKNIMNFISDH